MFPSSTFLKGPAPESKTEVLKLGSLFWLLLLSQFLPKGATTTKKGKFGKFYGYFLKLSLPFIFILFCFCSPNETSIESNSTKIVVKSINNPYLPARKSSSNQKNWGGFLHQLKGSFNRSFKRTMTLQKNSNQPKSFVKNNVNLSSSEADSHHLVYSNSASKFISETFVENNAGWWCRAVYINILLLLFGPSV